MFRLFYSANKKRVVLQREDGQDYINAVFATVITEHMNCVGISISHLSFNQVNCNKLLIITESQALFYSGSCAFRTVLFSSLTRRESVCIL
jgi:hypothetical protein